MLTIVFWSSFFNVMECEIVQLYVKRLVMVHNVLMQDIGIVTPYIRQVSTKVINIYTMWYMCKTYMYNCVNSM